MVGASPLMILLPTRRRCPSLCRSACFRATTATCLTCWRSTATQRYSACRVVVRLASPDTLITQWAPIKGWNHGWIVAIMPRPVRIAPTPLITPHYPNPHAVHHATSAQTPMSLNHTLLTHHHHEPTRCRCGRTTRCSRSCSTRHRFNLSASYPARATRRG
jgi:hypothetical protein